MRASECSNVASVLRTCEGGRLAWGLFLFYLATLGFYLYVRLTSTLDLGLHYQWCAHETLEHAALKQSHVHCNLRGKACAMLRHEITRSIVTSAL